MVKGNVSGYLSQKIWCKIQVIIYPKLQAITLWINDKKIDGKNFFLKFILRLEDMKLVKSTNVSSYPELKRKFWSFNEITYRKNA